MAYGVVMGQTPILSASGIEYDNSQTASVITGNNVQLAIDESVKKIQTIENKVNSGVQWDLLANHHIEKQVTTREDKFFTLVEKPLKGLDLRTPILFMNVTGNIKTSYDSTSLKLLFSDFTPSSRIATGDTYVQDVIYFSKGLENNVDIYFPLFSSGKRLDSTDETMIQNVYETRYEEKYTLFYVRNCDFKLLAASNTLGTSTINLNLTFQIYGLKAPI